MRARLVYQGRRLVNFSSNDYLGLASHPRVKAAAQAAIEEFHASAGSSRLICGNLAIHERLESRLAGFKQKEAALVFSSGYAANLGIIAALVGEGDQIFSDALNHASIIDGCRLSRAQVFVYRHRDLNHLEDLLRDGTGCTTAAACQRCGLQHGWRCGRSAWAGCTGCGP